MINFEKMDDKDFVFINESFNEKEERVFSNFLKERKAEKLKIVDSKRISKQHAQTVNKRI